MESIAYWVSLAGGAVALVTAVVVSFRRPDPSHAGTLAMVAAVLILVPLAQRIVFKDFSYEARVGRAAGWLELWIPGNPAVEETTQLVISSKLGRMSREERRAFDEKLTAELRRDHVIVTTSDILAETLHLLGEPELAKQAYRKKSDQTAPEDAAPPGP